MHKNDVIDDVKTRVLIMYIAQINSDSIIIVYNMNEWFI